MWRLIIGVIGVVLCVIGAVWVGQGVGSIHGSPMTGHSQWTVIGAILIVLGLVALVRAGYRRRR